MRLDKHYSTDDCLADEREKLLDFLEELSDKGIIEYSIKNRFIITIDDIELTDENENDLIDLLEETGAYPLPDEEDLDLSGEDSDDW